MASFCVIFLMLGYLGFVAVLASETGFAALIFCCCCSEPGESSRPWHSPNWSAHDFCLSGKCGNSNHFLLLSFIAECKHCVLCLFLLASFGGGRRFTRFTSLVAMSTGMLALAVALSCVSNLIGVCVAFFRTSQFWMMLQL